MVFPPKPRTYCIANSAGGISGHRKHLFSLNEDETRNSLAIVRAAFEKPENIQPTAKEPSRTLLMLHHLADITDPGNLKREIDETIAYFQAR